MSQIWTKAEEAALFEAMGGKNVMLAPKAREIAKMLPGRTAEAIRRHWLLIRWDRKPEQTLVGNSDTLTLVKELLRRHGLRGRVTFELGD